MNSPCTRSVTTCKKSSGVLYVHITAGSSLAVLVSIQLHNDDTPISTEPWNEYCQYDTHINTEPWNEYCQYDTPTNTEPWNEYCQYDTPLIQNLETSTVNHFRSSENFGFVNYFGEQIVNELEGIQWQFKSFCHRHFFKHWPHNYAGVLDYVKFRTPRVRRRNLNMPFLVDV